MEFFDLILSQSITGTFRVIWFSLAFSVLLAQPSGLEDQSRRRGIPVAEKRQRRQSTFARARDPRDHVHDHGPLILEMNRRIPLIQRGTNDENDDEGYHGIDLRYGRREGNYMTILNTIV